MYRQTITTSTNKYDVIVSNKILEQLTEFLPRNYQNIMIITDSNVYNLYGHVVSEQLEKKAKVSTSVVPAGESSKSIEEYYRLLTEAIQNNLDRKSLIVALGGGMIGDLAGFVAASYMRGVDFIQIPTTILAHDSSVGGKVAINHPEGKNLIGSFYPPQAVIYDISTLHSLPASEKRSGYAEIAKHGLISDSDYFFDVLNTDLLEPIDAEMITNHLRKGIAVKAKIVEQDEKESNVRKFLNFGHTLGHAIESELGYGAITHGEAIAVGMLFALKVSQKTFDISLPYHELYNWLDKNKYPLQLPSLSVGNLIARMKKDKKSENAIVQMVLLKNIGKPVAVNLKDYTLYNLLENFIRELGS